MNPLINDLLELSREYGADERYVLLGGGNTSVKDGDTLYVKASGCSLAEITIEGFVKMSLKSLGKMWDASLPEDEGEREKVILDMMMDARKEGETARPSVEALLHALLPERYVVHLHPAIINGLTCSRSAGRGVMTYFPDALWVPITNPGFTLATVIRRLQEKYNREKGKSAQVIFLQNHGVFISADTAEGIRASYQTIMETLTKALVRRPDFTRVDYPEGDVETMRSALNSVLPPDGKWSFMVNRELIRYLESYDRSYAIRFSYTPDHIVYSGVAPLWVPSSVLSSQSPAQTIASLIEGFRQEQGALPKVVLVEKLGAFANSSRALTLFVDTVKVAVFTESFGGPLFMERQYVDFIRDWEVENYRAKVTQ